MQLLANPIHRLDGDKSQLDQKEISQLKGVFFATSRIATVSDDFVQVKHNTQRFSKKKKKTRPGSPGPSSQLCRGCRLPRLAWPGPAPAYLETIFANPGRILAPGGQHLPPKMGGGGGRREKSTGCYAQTGEAPKKMRSS